MHFIAGLPRAGSTLLSAVLRQNPRLHAAITSPVAGLCFAVLPDMSAPNPAAALFTDERRAAVLRGLFEGYYAAPDQRPVIFDTNRVWSGNVPLVASLYPASRIICCVRDIGWIIDSIECMLRRNPLQCARVFAADQARTVYTRTEALMNLQIGLIGAAWANLRDAWFSPFADRLLVMSYDGFVADPAGAMQRLYSALGEPGFPHDFDHVSHDAAAYDSDLGMPGLHRVAPRIAPTVRQPTIPPDIFNQYASSSFWRGMSPRAGGPVVIC